MSDVPSDHPLQAWLAATRGGSTGEAGPAPAPDQQPPVPAGAVSKRLLAATAGVCLAAVILGVATSGVLSGPPAAGGAGEPAAPAALPTAGPTAIADTGVSAGASAEPSADADPGAGASEPAAQQSPATAAGPAVAAAAVIAVRTAAPPDLYVDTAVVDQVTAAAGLTLVGVRAVVVPRIDGRWGAPMPARYAVPIGVLEGAPVALAQPWRLPLPAPVPPEPRLAAVRGGELVSAATDAVARAGYRDVTDLRLSRSPAMPAVLVAALRGIAPGDAVARPAQVWLSADAAHVLGAPTTVDLPVPQEQP